MLTTRVELGNDDAAAKPSGRETGVGRAWRGMFRRLIMLTLAALTLAGGALFLPTNQAAAADYVPIPLFSPFVPVSGTLVDPWGRAVPGALVQFSQTSGYDNSVRGGYSNAYGKFSTQLIAGNYYNITATTNYFAYQGRYCRYSRAGTIFVPASGTNLGGVQMYLQCR